MTASFVNQEINGLELQERKENRLHFKWSDKDRLGHRWKHLFLREECLGEDDDGNVVMGDEECKEYILKQFSPWGQQHCPRRGMM